MPYVTINTKVPEKIAKEFKKYAKTNGLTVSMALKLLILGVLKKPDTKIQPYLGPLEERLTKLEHTMEKILERLSNEAM